MHHETGCRMVFRGRPFQTARSPWKLRAFASRRHPSRDSSIPRAAPYHSAKRPTKKCRSPIVQAGRFTLSLCREQDYVACAGVSGPHRDQPAGRASSHASQRAAADGERRLDARRGRPLVPVRRQRRLSTPRPGVALSRYGETLAASLARRLIMLRLPLTTPFFACRCLTRVTRSTER